MPYSDIFAWMVMITGYAQNGLLDLALKLFNEIPQRNLVSWNTMIAGLHRMVMVKKLSSFFRQMHLANARADLKTFSSILLVCADLEALQQE